MFMLDTQQPKIRQIIAIIASNYSKKFWAHVFSFKIGAPNTTNQVSTSAGFTLPLNNCSTTSHCLSTTAQQIHTASQQHCLSTISPISPQNTAAVQVPGGTEVIFSSWCCTKCPEIKSTCRMTFLRLTCKHLRTEAAICRIVWMIYPTTVHDLEKSFASCPVCGLVYEGTNVNLKGKFKGIAGQSSIKQLMMRNCEILPSKFTVGIFLN